MKNHLTEIFDIDELKKLCESFTNLNGLVTAILDLEGKVHVATGWQPICTKFHRINKNAAKSCAESDTILAGQIKKGQKYNIYKCKNGLYDVAVPIIVGKQHIGNFFTGQFLTEKPDVDFFKKQAETHQFNETEYIKALHKVPIFSEIEIKKNVDFFVNLVKIIGHLGLSNINNKEKAIQLQDTLEEYQTLNEEYLSQNEELIKAKETAEEANRLKTEFLRNMSHEIRTPMNGIIGFSKMFDNPNISDEKRKSYSKIVQSSSHQLLGVIDDILEISALQTKQEQLNETEFCLNDLLSELFEVFSLKSQEKNISIHLKKEFDDKQSYILSDKTKLSKILSNLLENALKYTTDGFIEIGYLIKKELLTIYVKDTGIGVFKESQEIIFERFSQEDKELSKKVGGLGLGLSIAKESAQLLGGDIILESEKGKGSTFYVNIPFKSINNSVSHNIKKSSEMLALDKTLTILVAEDEEINYLYIEELFEEENDGSYNLIRAKNGKEAVDICLSKNIDIVLMDIKMPIMNGLEATEKIKKELPDLPIIVQTAYTQKSDKEIALKHGCDDFISKPVDAEILFKLINKHVKTE